MRGDGAREVMVDFNCAVCILSFTERSYNLRFFMAHIIRVATSCLIGASVLAACGGGSGSSSSTPTPSAPPPSAPTTSAPVAVASTATSTVSEGGQFSVTAANSSDPDGDAISFSWTQTAGPNALSGTVGATTLTLNAPIVTLDTVLTFELTVSDGTNSDTDTVSVTIQPLGAPVTVRPSAPINTDLAILNGITDEGEDQYRIYWADGFFPGGNNIASQTFSDDGTPVGTQVNGSFDLPQTGSTFSTQIDGLIPISIVESGGTLYSQLIYIFQNAVPQIGNLVGPFEGNLSPVNDPFAAFASSTEIDQTPIGQNNLVNVTSFGSSVDAFVQVSVFNPDGSVEEDIPFAYEEFALAGDPEATVSSVSDPAVSPIGEDGYIVVWRREDSNASPTARSIEAQIYSSANVLEGSRIEIDASAGPSFGGGTQLDAAALGDGNSLITWVESQNFAANGDFIDFVVRGRIINPEGGFVTDEFSISDNVNEQFVTTSLSLNNEDVLVVWGEGDSTLKARVVSTVASRVALASEFTLAENVAPRVFVLNQTQTGRVLVGYNLNAGNNAVTSEVISFCPVGCE